MKYNSHKLITSITSIIVFFLSIGNPPILLILKNLQTSEVSVFDLVLGSPLHLRFYQIPVFAEVPQEVDEEEVIGEGPGLLVDFGPQVIDIVVFYLFGSSFYIKSDITFEILTDFVPILGVNIDELLYFSVLGLRPLLF